MMLALDLGLTECLQLAFDQFLTSFRGRISYTDYSARVRFGRVRGATDDTAMRFPTIRFANSVRGSARLTHIRNSAPKRAQLLDL